MPESISVNNDAFADYLKVASLPRKERQESFRNLSNEQKVSFVKVQFALQFVKRPNLTKQQKDFLLESMSKVSVDLYDKENPEKVALANTLNQEIEAKAFGLFAQKDAFEILEGVGAGKDKDVELLQKYEDLLKSKISFRKTLVKQMPISESVAIWKTQLAYHLATSSLSKEQKEFIVEILPEVQISFEKFSQLPGEERTKYFEELEARMFRTFTKAEAFALFMEIGIQKTTGADIKPSEQSEVRYTNQSFRIRPQAVKFNFSETSGISLKSEIKSARFLTAAAVQTWSCGCRFYCSGSGQSCNDADCRESYTCGPFGTWQCTARCTADLLDRQ